MLMKSGGYWGLLLAAVLVALPLAAQGGFNREAITFGEVGNLTTDIAVGDFDFNDKTDVIVATSEGDHMIHWAIADTTPPTPTVLAASRGHSLLVMDAFGGSGQGPGNDIVIVDEEGYRLYLNDGYGGFYLEDEHGVTGHGRPLFAKAGYFADDTVKGIVVGYATAVVCIPMVYEIFEETPYYVIEVGDGINSMHAMDIVPDNDRMEVLILVDGIVEVYTLGETAATLYGSTYFEGAVHIAPGCEGCARLAVATTTELKIFSWDPAPEDLFQFEVSGDLPYHRAPLEIQAAEITGDTLCDFVIRASGVTYILKQTSEGFEHYEVIGQPDGEHAAAIRIYDVDDDSHPDIVVATGQYEHKAYLSRNRLTVDILDADPVDETVDGQNYLVFPIELDAEPISAVHVLVEFTVDEPEPLGMSSQPSSKSGPSMQPMHHTLHSHTLPPRLITMSVVRRLLYVHIPPALVNMQITAHVTFAAGAMQGMSAHGLVSPVTNPTYDWTLDGAVNASVQSQDGDVYIGGDFTGMTWEVNDGLGTIDFAGRRRNPIDPVTPALGSHYPPQFNVVKADENGNLYVGGKFKFQFPNPLYTGPSGPEPEYIYVQNIARITPTGEWDHTFHPNPNGEVHAIEFGRFHHWSFTPWGSPVQNWILFGGWFSALEHQHNSALNLPVWGFAQVNRDFTSYHVHQGYVANHVNYIRVSGSVAADPIEATATVRAITFSDSPYGQRLAIGGQHIRSVRFGWLPGYQTWPHGPSKDVDNIAIFALTLTPAYTGTHPQPSLLPAITAARLPRVLKSSLSNPQPEPGDVTEAVVTSIQIGSSASAFAEGSQGLLALAKRAVVFAGNFDRVFYDASASYSDPQPHTRIAYVANIGMTNLGGHIPDVGELPNVGAPISSIAIDQEDRVWVARDSSDSLWVYNLEPSVPALVPVQEFDFGPSGAGWFSRRIIELAFNPHENEMVAVGSFESRPATKEHAGTSTVQQIDLSANNITVYSTDQAPEGSPGWTGFGAHRLSFRASANGVLNTVAVFGGAVPGGYAFAEWPNSETLTHITVERPGIAALTHDHRILDWGPLLLSPTTSEAPVIHAMSMGDAVDGPVYFAGRASVFGLPPGGSGLDSKVMAALADGHAVYPIDWWAQIDPTQSSSDAAIFALLAPIGNDHVLIGGDYADLGNASRGGIGAVLAPGVGSPGAQNPVAWHPELEIMDSQSNFVAGSVVHALYQDPNDSDVLYIGGDLRAPLTSPIDGLVRTLTPHQTLPDRDEVDPDFDIGLSHGEHLVHAITMDPATDDVYVAGEFGPGVWPSNFGTRIAICWDANTESQRFDVVAVVDFQGPVLARGLAIAFVNDTVVIGGNFHKVWEDGITDWVSRSGAVAVDTSGDMTVWQPVQLLEEVPAAEEVRTILASDSLLPSDQRGLWLGGYYTATAIHHFNRFPLP
jgi:hypothetical protein